MEKKYQRDRLVVGVDFGTTFSGMAEAYSGREPEADEIQIIRQWPGAHGITSEKVPSELAYGPPQITLPTMRPDYGAKIPSRPSSLEGVSTFIDVSTLDAALRRNADAPTDKIRWGYQLRQNEIRLRCMKLLLDSKAEIPAYISKSNQKSQLQQLKKSAENAVTDYLTELLKHAEEVLERRYGETFIANTAIDLVFTVPAVWSDAARDATLRAAAKATSNSGIPNVDNLSLISEPEAAAVYSLLAMQPSSLNQSDNFVVCDAGGGTVDLISYEITQVSPLRIEESTEGTGKCCGAAFLNMRFEQFVRSRLGEAAFMNMCSRDPRCWMEASKAFEDYVKRNYTADEDSEYGMDYSVPLPGALDDRDAGVESGYLTMTSAEVGEIFRPVIQDILGLVDDQIGRLKQKHKRVAGILLVGGFGQNEHLFLSLKKRFGGDVTSPPPYSSTTPSNEKAGTRIPVLQPPNAWTAVVRGAVLRGLEGEDIVTSRVSRFNYGVVCRPHFDQSIHPVSCRIWDDLTESWKAENRVRWYIAKGQTVLSSERILFNFHNHFEHLSDKKTSAKLIFNQQDDTPSAFDERRNSTTPILCTLEANVNVVPERYFEKKINSKGKKYEQLSYVLGMQVTSGVLKFDLRVGGVVYGEVTARFEG